MKKVSSTPGFRPKKIALILSALLATASFPAVSAPVYYKIDESTQAADRTLNFADGAEISGIEVLVNDGIVNFNDNTTINS